MDSYNSYNSFGRAITGLSCRIRSWSSFHCNSLTLKAFCFSPFKIITDFTQIWSTFRGGPRARGVGDLPPPPLWEVFALWLKYDHVILHSLNDTQNLFCPPLVNVWIRPWLLTRLNPPPPTPPIFTKFEYQLANEFSKINISWGKKTTTKA